MKSIKILLSILIISLFTGNAYAYRHLSPYAYCAGDPVNNVDPDGRQTVVVGITNIPLLGTAEPLVLGRTPVISTADKIVNAGKPIAESQKSGIENIGKASTPEQSHHIIPRQANKLEQTKIARKEGVKMDGKENKIDVPKYSRQEGTGQHGNHPNYNKQVMDRISQMIEEAGGPSYAQQFRNLVEKIRKIISDSPDTKINDIKLNSTTSAVQ